MQLSEMIDLERYPLTDRDYVAKCQARFHADGVVVLPGFLTESAIQQVHDEAIEGMPQAYYCKTESNVYLLPRDPERPPEHARNRLVSSSKGCICDDTIPADSPLRVAYQSEIFQGFVKGVTGQASLYPYADTLSSINIHYAHQGQELGWHFDNSAFAITLLIQAAQDGGEFQYVSRFRNASAGDMNHAGVERLLNGEYPVRTLEMLPGTLVLFQGRDSIHRVTPNRSDVTRILAVLAYNAKPGVGLSEHARMSFFGRLK